MRSRLWFLAGLFSREKAGRKPASLCSIWPRVAWRSFRTVWRAGRGPIGARLLMNFGKSGVIERYIYRPIYKLYIFIFIKKPRPAAERKKDFRKLARQLASLGWISQGYAQNRGPGAGGPFFPWTRKVKGKNVSVALS